MSQNDIGTDTTSCLSTFVQVKTWTQIHAGEKEHAQPARCSGPGPITLDAYCLSAVKGSGF